MILQSEINEIQTMSKERLLEEKTYREHKIRVCTHNEWLNDREDHRHILKLVEQKISEL